MVKKNQSAEEKKEKISILDKEILAVEERKKKLDQKQKELQQKLMIRIGRYVLNQKEYRTFNEFKKDFDELFKNK